MRGLPMHPAMKKPTKRSECFAGPRPCPWMSCKYNLLLSKGPLSDAKIEKIFDKNDIEEKPASCTLDVSEKEEQLTLEQIGDIMGVTRERIRQIEVSALKKVKREMEALEGENKYKPKPQPVTPKSVTGHIVNKEDVPEGKKRVPPWLQRFYKGAKIIDK